MGTSWHGVLESDRFRRALLSWVAERRDLDWSPGEMPFAAAREAQLDKLGDLVAENIDREALVRLIDDGPPFGLPVVAGQLISRSAGQQPADSVASRPEASPLANGEGPAFIPPAFAAPGSDEQRGKS